MENYERLAILNASFHRVRFSDVMDVIRERIVSGERLTIGYMNLHGAYLARIHDGFSACMEKFDLVYADGMPLVLFRKFLAGDCGTENRFTLSQRLPEFLRHAIQHGHRIYYIGSEERVLGSGLSRLRAEYPGLEIDGHHGFFDKSPSSAENLEVIDRVNAYRPDILMVGMGMPVQEQWILNNAAKIDSTVIYSTGAAIEYFSGYVRRPPAWVSNHGFEGLFRLMSEPRKLWYRYLVEPFFLLPSALDDIKRAIWKI